MLRRRMCVKSRVFIPIMCTSRFTCRFSLSLTYVFSLMYCFAVNNENKSYFEMLFCNEKISSSN